MALTGKQKKGIFDVVLCVMWIVLFPVVLLYKLAKKT